MRFVEQLVGRPGHCIFHPQIGPSHREGFVVSNSLLEDHYEQGVSVTALRDIAQKIPQANLVSKDELTKALAELEATKAENEVLKEDLKQADQVINAIDVLEGAEFRARKKPGRKPASKTP